MSVNLAIIQEEILFIYSTKYFKDIFVPGNKSIINLIFIEVLSEIGKTFSNEIKGNGSHQHKGIKKLIEYIAIEKKMNITGREIKSLFKSKTTYNFDLKKIKTKKYEKIFFPYRVALILGSLIEIMNSDERIGQRFLSYKNKEAEKVGNVDLFISDFFTLFRAYVNRIDTQSRFSKTSLESLDAHRKRCSLILTDLSKLNL